MNTEEQIAAWQQLIGSSPNLKEEYERISKELTQTNNPNPSGVALNRVYSKVRNQLRSKAPSWTGVIVAKSDPTDYNEYKWKKAAKDFAENPGLAMEGTYNNEGKLTFKTNEKGEPLDVTPFWPSGDENKNYLKPIPKNAWTRYMDGVAGLTTPEPGKPEGAIPKRFSLTLKGDLADPNSQNFFDPPTDVPIEFRALDKTKKGDAYMQLSGAVVTKWTPSKVTLPATPQIVDEFYKENIIPAHEIVKTFEAKGKAFVIVQGFVVSMNREPNKLGSRMVQITTVEMDQLEKQKTITGWVPKHVKMDFSEESEVRLIGTLDRRAVYEEGKKTDELGEVNINVRAIQVIEAVMPPATTSEFDPAKFSGTPESSGMPQNFMT